MTANYGGCTIHEPKGCPCCTDAAAFLAAFEAMREALANLAVSEWDAADTRKARAALKLADDCEE